MDALKIGKVKRMLPNKVWFLLLTLILTGLLVLGFSFEEIEPVLPLSFSVGSGEDAQIIQGWFNEDGICYVFLPSNKELADIYMHKTTVLPIWIEDVPLEEEVSLCGFSLGKPYAVKTAIESFDVVFMQSDKLSTVYIQTSTGSMDRIHADKNYREDVQVSVFDSSGCLNYSGEGFLKGRGNSSWGAVKKPYLLGLDEAGDILHMGDACNWILIAAYSDQTYLRNKLAFSLAESSGLEWTPESEYVDVYLNGVYNGLYLLTEKIEFGEYRLAQEDAESFLCKVEYDIRWDNLSNPVRTDFGRVVEILEPEELAEGDYERIAETIQAMENAILYGSEEEIRQILDVDSWVRRYLVDEISENNDADIASSYFYYKNGKIYAGPVWDYDIAFGNYYSIKNPRALYATFYDPDQDGMPYYHGLYQHAFFRERVAQIYEAEFLPVLDRMVETQILSLAEEIADAAFLDVIRWNPELGWTPASVQVIGPDPDPANLLEHLRQRRDFLSSLWLENREYCYVRVELMKDATLACFAVPKGESFGEYSGLTALDSGVTVWYDSRTGDTFDPDCVITEDLVLLQDS